MEKYWKFLIENRFWNLIKNKFSSKIENFENLDFSKIFNWNPTFSKFPKKLDLNWKFSKIENFENRKFENFEISIFFDFQNFQQKIDRFFRFRFENIFLDLFRSKNVPRFQKSYLEQRGSHSGRSRTQGGDSAVWTCLRREPEKIYRFFVENFENRKNRNF